MALVARGTDTTQEGEELMAHDADPGRQELEPAANHE